MIATRDNLTLTAAAVTTATATSTSTSTMKTRRTREGKGRGGRTTRLPGGSGGLYYPHRRMGGAAPAPRQRRRPLALEDQLVLCHDFVPANSPAPPPAMTTTRMTPSGPKSDEGDGRRQHKRDIIESLDGGRRQRGQ
jgi:hypothetical protein